MAEDLATGRPRSSRRAVAVRIISIAFSAVLLVLLYRSLDLHGVGRVLRDAHPVWLTVSLAMLIPITLMRAARFYWLVPRGAITSFGEALRMTLVASAVNMFLPAKTGDFTKSFILARRGDAAIGMSTAVVVFERLADILGLIVWCVAGYVVVKPVAPVLPGATWLGLTIIGVMVATVLASKALGTRVALVVARYAPRSRASDLVGDILRGWHALLSALGSKRFALMAYSVALWFVQLLQIWLFTLAVGAQVPPAVCATLSAIAVVIGQLPLTFGGIGARDVALVVLFSAYTSPEQAAAVGILTTSRNLLPPIAAIPFLRRYFALLIPASEQQKRA